jgi:excisionase family DNA binding protein
MKKQKAYLSSREVEALLGISRSTLDRWVKNGKLKFFRLPSGHRRFFRSEIEAILKNNK